MIDLEDLVKENIIHTSVLGRKWSESIADKREILTFCQKKSLPEIISKILVSKNISLNEIDNFLYPTIKTSLPNPFHLKDMEKGANRILRAIQNNETIAIFGDYDVDGATSSALLAKYFDSMNVNYLIYIPDRIKEGYGPNINACLELKDKGASVIITVDCGTMAISALEEATNNNLDIIVIDHHLSGYILPKIFALINPNRLDEKSEYVYLAAVGVVFLFITAVNMLFKQNNIEKKLPNLLQFLDLVALGTICDIVPIKGLNRSYVKQGLKIIALKQNLGLTILTEAVSINTEINTYHLGYVLGPRINAGGRVGESNLGVKLLVSKDVDEARNIATQLNNFNNERRIIELAMLEEAFLQAEILNNKNKVLVISGENWHPGVIGIIASRIKDKYSKPVAILAINGAVAKASCRSVSGFNFGNAITNAKIEKLVIEGGGHSMAAGFSINPNKIEALQSFLNEEFDKTSSNDDFNISHYISTISIEGINNKLCLLLDSIGPFGAENQEPRLMINNVFIYKAEIFANEHIRIIIGNSQIKTGKMLYATYFRSVGTKIGDLLLSRKIANFSLIGFLRMNYWRGKEKVDFIIEDVVI